MYKRALIFINGEVSNLDFLSGMILPDDQLIAVDGGLRHLLALNRQPHLLIGDLDSVTPAQLQALRDAKVEILKFPVDKDETDLGSGGGIDEADVLFAGNAEHVLDALGFQA